MSKTILCVDDSATMQTVAEITFRKTEYEYVGARSAEEALAQARSAKPALVLADAAMPDKTGYDLCLELKKDPALGDVPVIVMCGNAQAYDAARGEKVGADGHVTKPWDSQVMLDKVAEFLAQVGDGGANRPEGAGGASPSAKAPAVLPTKSPAPSAAPAKPDPVAPAAKPAAALPTKAPAPAAAPAKPAPPAAKVPPVPAVPARPAPRSPAAKPAPTETLKSTPRAPAMTPPPKPVEVATPRAATPTPTPRPAPAKPPRAPTTPPPATIPSDDPRDRSRGNSGGAPPQGGIAPALASASVRTMAKPPHRPPMIKGSPKRRAGTVDTEAATQVRAATPARSATLMGMPLLRMPPATRAVPAGVTPVTPAPAAPADEPEIEVDHGDPQEDTLSAPPPSAPEGGVQALINARVPEAAQAAMSDAGLDPNGPEAAALVKLSREVVERIVWEVVPELAETIIRENLDALTAKSR